MSDRDLPIIGGPGRDRSILGGLRAPGIQPSRQRFTKVVECAGCGKSTTDFVMYDAGPNPSVTSPMRRIALFLCVEVDRSPVTQYLKSEEAHGCAADYVEFARVKIESGLTEGMYMHDVLRWFVRDRRPSVTFPDTVNFGKLVPDPTL